MNPSSFHLDTLLLAALCCAEQNLNLTKKKKKKISEFHHPSLYIIFIFLYRNEKSCLISFCFPEKNNSIQIWNNMRLNIYWQDFGANYPFKNSFWPASLEYLRALDSENEDISSGLAEVRECSKLWKCTLLQNIRSESSLHRFCFDFYIGKKQTIKNNVKQESGKQ